MSPESLVELLGRERASAILRTHDRTAAVAAMEAAVAGGFRVVEFTLTIPDAYGLIEEFARRDGLVVGAGTVLETEQARRAVEAGASFLVSPVTDEAVIAAAGELGVAAMPGAHTPTEMLRAHRAGAQLVKLFPVPAGGPVWLRSVLAPLPFLKVVPTNGVDAANVAAWLEAGAWAAGFTTPLFDPGDMAARRWSAIEERARTILEHARPAAVPA
jgi:2-dehydro-3-deoxyphosphogluconate aldolase/(4S)-4-hydroxy-2-oxoglutarate aldolase